MCPGTYIAKSEVEAYIAKAVAENLIDQQARDIAIQKLAKVGLSEDVAFLSPAELSGGMQKRVGLARAIAAAAGGPPSGG